MKDSQDPGTIDGLPAKLGRPCIDPEKGPMTIADRQKRYRAGKKVVQFRITEKQKGQLDAYCKAHGYSRDEMLSMWIDKIESRDLSLPPKMAFL